MKRAYRITATNKIYLQLFVQNVPISYLVITMKNIEEHCGFFLIFAFNENGMNQLQCMQQSYEMCYIVGNMVLIMWNQ